jgi:hypothetical protein
MATTAAGFNLGLDPAQASPHAGDAKTPAVFTDKMVDGGGRRTRRTYRRIPNLRKGSLISLGYSASASTKTRRRAVDRAIQKYGKLSTLRKLNAVAVYTRRTNPATSRVFTSDIRYVQKK